MSIYITKISEHKTQTKNRLHALVDLSAAFDMINHAALVNKPKCYRIHESAIKFITDYLKDRAQFTQNWRTNTFMIFMNDIMVLEDYYFILI